MTETIVPVSSILKKKDLVKCKADESIYSVVKMMVKSNTGAIVIVDDENHPIGIFTERDVMKKVACNSKIDTKKTPIEEVMTKEPICISAKDDLKYCFALMRLNNFRHVIITDSENKLSDIVSIRDTFYYLCDRK